MGLLEPGVAPISILTRLWSGEMRLEAAKMGEPLPPASDLILATVGVMGMVLPMTWWPAALTNGEFG